MAYLTKHIQECPVCRAEYADYCQFLDEVRQLPDPDFPFYFHELSMRNISEHVPPNDHVIDELLEGIKKRERLRDKRQKRAKKASQATTRWAGVAIAACLLIISIFTVQAFDLTSRLASSDSYDAAPAAAATEMAEMESMYDLPDDIQEQPLLGAALYDTDEDMDFSSDLFDDIMPEMALPADIPTEWAADLEHNMNLETGDSMPFYGNIYDDHAPLYDGSYIDLNPTPRESHRTYLTDDEQVDDTANMSAERGESDQEDYDGYLLPLPAASGAGVAEQTTASDAMQTANELETQALADYIETLEPPLNDESLRIWPAAIFASMGLACIIGILFFIRMRQK